MFYEPKGARARQIATGRVATERGGVERMGGMDDDAEASDPEPSPELREFVRESLANDADGSLRRFLDRSPKVVSLALACATARRIEGFCRALFGGPYLAARVQGDEYVYQHLRTSLIAQLGNSEEFAQARTIALTELPATLPHDPEPMYDLEWAYGIEPACRKLEAELVRLAVAHGVDPFDRGPDVFLKTADRSIACVKEIMASAERKFAARHGLPLPGEAEPVHGEKAPVDADSSAQGRGRPPRRPGRTPVHLPYDVARRTWWQLADDVAPGRPNQQEFCDRLTALGHPMSPRTLRDRIGAWRREGLAWEPPRPAD